MPRRSLSPAPAPMQRSSSSSSSVASTECSPLLQSTALPSSANGSRAGTPSYTAPPPDPQARPSQSSALQQPATTPRTRRPSTTARPTMPTPQSASRTSDLEAQQPAHGHEVEEPTGRRGSSTGPSRYVPDPKQYAADHDNVHERDALADGDEAGESSTNVLPFPRQRDPSKPLRPDHYTTKRSIEKLRGFINRNQGLCLLALSQGFFATMNLFFKLLNSLPADESPQITALEIIFIRMSITWIGCVAFMLISGVEQPFLGPKEVRGLLALRGFSGFFGLFGLYYSLQYLSLADATVITFLAPLATGFLGYLTLGERFTLREFLGGVSSMCGVVLIARPAFIFGRKVADEDLDVPTVPEALGGGDNVTATTAGKVAHEVLRRGAALWLRASGDDGLTATPGAKATQAELQASSAHPGGVTEAERLMAVGLALLGICGAAGAYISIRAIGRRASATHSVAYFSLYSTIVSAILMWTTGTPFVLPKSAKWCSLLVCIGIFGLLAQILLAMGLQREKAGRASSAVYLQIVFASLYQLFILHVPINALSAVGMTIILCSAGWIAMAKE